MNTDAKRRINSVMAVVTTAILLTVGAAPAFAVEDPAPQATITMTAEGAPAEPAASRDATSTDAASAPEDASSTPGTPDSPIEPASDSPQPTPDAATDAADTTDGADDALSPAAPARIDAITGVKVDGAASRVGVGGTFHLRAEWRLPDGTAAGTHFGMDLPGALRYAEVHGFPLLTDSNEVSATCDAVGGGLECVTTDFAQTHHGVHGDLWVSVKAVAAAQHIAVTAGTATFTLPVSTGAPDFTPPAQPTKTGSLHGNRIDWVVTVPASARRGDHLDLTDTWAQSGLALTGPVTTQPTPTQPTPAQPTTLTALPHTGGQISPLIYIAPVLIVIGVVTLVGGRRRRED